MRNGGPDLSFYSAFPLYIGFGRRAAYVHLKAQMVCLPIISKVRQRNLKVILYFLSFMTSEEVVSPPQPENSRE